jgi:hypothetical protein
MANTLVLLDIPVSIDAQGNITCPDKTVNAGTPLTWPVSAQGGTITAITPGSPAPFSTPQSNGTQWSATAVSSGTYTLSGRTSGGQPTQRQARPPRITITVPKKK